MKFNRIAAASVFIFLGACSTDPVPSIVSSGSVVGTLAAGPQSTCVLKRGNLFCAGKSLGITPNVNAPGISTSPEKIEGLPKLKSVGIGEVHACGINEQDELLCWGNNMYGQIGINQSGSFPPTVISQPGEKVSLLAVGPSHNCALFEAAGKKITKCWGMNDLGQLGEGQSSGFIRVPTPVSYLQGVPTQISVNTHGSCFLINGKAYCAGLSSAILPCGKIYCSIPQEVTAFGILDSLHVGHTNYCGLREGALLCGGNNFEGSISVQPGSHPVHVVKGFESGVRAVVQKAGHLCAVLEGNIVRCMGSSLKGQRANTNLLLSYKPATDVEGLPQGRIEAIAAGIIHTCVLIRDQVWCWGADNAAQLGTGARVVSTQADFLISAPNGTNPVSIGVGVDHACFSYFHESSTRIACSGRGDFGQLGNGQIFDRDSFADVSFDSSLGSVTAVGSGTAHSCALIEDEQVQCWGSNLAGSVGNGLGTGAAVIVEPQTVIGIPSPGKIYDMEVDGIRSCISRFDTEATVYCWGGNKWGAAGQDPNVHFNVREAMEVLGGNFGPDPVRLAVGLFHTCAYVEGGTVDCWGLNTWGVLGTGNNFSNPAQRYRVKKGSGLGDLTGVLDVAGGTVSTCAVVQVGGAGGQTDIRCWGSNHFGELGTGGAGQNGSGPSNLYYPTLVQNSEGIGATRVEVSHAFACALVSGKKGKGLGVKCWGQNRFGQLGDGTSVDRPYLEPTDVGYVIGAESNVVSVSLGDFSACARKANGESVCWGHNSFGQFGFGGRPGSFGSATIAFKPMKTLFGNVIGGFGLW